MFITRELGGQKYHFWAMFRLGHLAVGEGNLVDACNIFADSIQLFQLEGIGDNIVFPLEGVASLFVVTGKFEDASRPFVGPL
jgi:hypothetical protein